MKTSVYRINKGINNPIGFKGLKAQYIWYLGGGLICLLIFFCYSFISAGGVRVENTVSVGILTGTQSNVNKRVKRNYINLFPSGGLTLQSNKKSQLALTYSKRIERPNYSSLNPFEYKLDEMSFRRSNPLLQPTIH